MVCFEGVPRETDEEREFADFDIFDDPETPYSTFNFQYSNQAFTQLHSLMEFNTLNNIEVSCGSIFYLKSVHFERMLLPLTPCILQGSLVTKLICFCFPKCRFSAFYSNDTLCFKISKYNKFVMRRPEVDKKKWQRKFHETWRKLHELDHYESLFFLFWSFTSAVMNFLGHRYCVLCFTQVTCFKSSITLLSRSSKKQ